jgi:hypothetical protein
VNARGVRRQPEAEAVGFPALSLSDDDRDVVAEALADLLLAALETEDASA